MSEPRALHLPDPGSSMWAGVPVLVALVLVGAIWFRYDNSWAENDTVTLTQAASTILAAVAVMVALALIVAWP